jgi:capsular polysaccharide biosynthesis protein
LRNKVDLIAEPDKLFLNPWREEGLKLLAAPDFMWRETANGVIDGFAVSAHPEINTKLRTFIGTVNRNKRFRKTVEINVVPAVLEHASFRKSHVMVGDRLVLSGASATRLFNNYRAESAQGYVAAGEALNDYLEQCRDANEGRRIAVENVFVEPDLDFAVECRNTFKYFHFITESLSQLCVLDEVGFQGNIYFHFPNQEEKQRGFAESFVEALFPEYAGRVFFERAPKNYDLVLTSFGLIGAMGQMPAADLAGLSRIAPADSLPASIEFLPVLAMNSVSSALLSLRARALKAIEGKDFSYLPKRFFVGRSDTASRPRPLAGQDLLLEHLLRFGFEYVVFEDHTPLEQIALMSQAEMMISHHGAGFTNMLFAAPDTYVIELGTLQTAQFRWADFWPLAHAAQCRYINFFADFNAEDPLREPTFSNDGLVPTYVSEKAAAQIMAFVVTVLGRAPTMPDAASLAQLGGRVLQAGAAEQAITLLAKHRGMVHGNLDLCILLADCHKALDEPKSELLALEAAFGADASRWQTLIRNIWCANRVERPQVIRWALSRLAADFPERHDAFVRNHDWVRFVA